MAPPQRCVKRMPSQLREGGEEVLGEPREGGVVLVEVGAHRAAVAVDGVVAAPQDAVVGGEPVVVEAVGRVADSLAAAPADRLALRAVQRLGDERVVVDRQHVAAHRAQQRRERARGQQHTPCPHPPPARCTSTPAPARASRVAGLCSNTRTPGRERGVAQPARQPAGVHERRAGAVPEPAEVGGRGDLGAHRLARRAARTSCPKPRSSAASSSSASTSCGSRATVRSPVSSRSQSMPCARGRRAGRRSSRRPAARAAASRPGSGPGRSRARA